MGRGSRLRGNDATPVEYRDEARCAPRILSREFGKDGSAWLTMHDQDTAKEMADEFGLALPVFEESRRFWHAVVDAGLGEEDPSHGVTALERRLGVSLESPNPAPPQQENA